MTQHERMETPGPTVFAEEVPRDVRPRSRAKLQGLLQISGHSGSQWRPGSAGVLPRNPPSNSSASHCLHGSVRPHQLLCQHTCPHPACRESPRPTDVARGEGAAGNARHASRASCSLLIPTPIKQRCRKSAGMLFTSSPRCHCTL